MELHEPAVLAFQLARAGTRIPMLDVSETGEIAASSLAIAFASAVSAAAGGGRISDEVHELTKESVNEICNVALAAFGEALPESNHDKLLVLCGTLCPQKALQTHTMSSFARFALLTGHVERDTLALSDTQELAGLFEAAWGLDVHQIVSALLITWLAAQRNGVIDPTTLVSKLPGRKKLVPALSHIMDAHSLGPSEVREQFLAESSSPPLARAFRIFARYPFVKMAADQFLASPHPHARLAFTQGLFFLTREAGALEAEQAGKSRYDNRFSRIMGKRFEQYSHFVFSQALPSYEGLSDYEYLRRGTELSPDGVYVGPRGRDVVVMQAKLRLPSRGLLLGDDSDPLYRDFGGTYAKLFSASIKWLYKIRDLDDRQFDEATMEFTKRVRDATRWTLVGVLPLYLELPMPALRKRLLEGVKEQLTSEQKDWFEELHSKGRIQLHIHSIETYEYFAGIGGTRSLVAYLRRWRAEFTKCLRAGTPPLGFQDWLKVHYPQGSALPILRSVHSELMEEVADFAANM